MSLIRMQRLYRMGKVQPIFYEILKDRLKHEKDGINWRAMCFRRLWRIKTRVTKSRKSLLLPRTIALKLNRIEIRWDKIVDRYLRRITLNFKGKCSRKRHALHKFSHLNRYLRFKQSQLFLFMSSKAIRAKLDLQIQLITLVLEKIFLWIFLWISTKYMLNHLKQILGLQVNLPSTYLWITKNIFKIWWAASRFQYLQRCLLKFSLWIYRLTISFRL